MASMGGFGSSHGVSICKSKGLKTGPIAMHRAKGAGAKKGSLGLQSKPKTGGMAKGKVMTDVNRGESGY